MALPTRIPRMLPETTRRKVEVAAAMAEEALIDEHARQVLDFIALFEGRLTFEEALLRYLREMDLSESIATTIRTRALVALEDGLPAGQPRLQIYDGQEKEETRLEAEDDRWHRFRPAVMVRGVIERQKRIEDLERYIELAIARAEEYVIKKHIDNAITFAALLDGHLTMSRAVQLYITTIQLTGGRSQSVLQRTMAQLAEVHLPTTTPATQEVPLDH